MTGAIRRGGQPAWGVQREYVDATGARRRVSAERLRAVEGCIRPVEGLDTAPAFVRPGAPLPKGVRTVELEGGGELPGGAVLAREAPYGYHRLVMRDGRRLAMVTSPGRCALPDALRGWGWAAQLYAVRSRQGWGVGDLGDLRALGTWSRKLGAAMLLVNPLHAVRPGLPQESSPYFPSSRLYRNPLYLRIQDIPDSRDDHVVQEVMRDTEHLRDAPIIDRNAIVPLKLRALESLWSRFRGDAGFDAYVAREGSLLERYACFCVLAERHAGSWTTWPARYRRPDGRALGELVTRDAPGLISTAGSSGCSTRSSRGPARHCRWSTTWPSASPRMAPMRGCGRTSSLPRPGSARRPTTSIPPGRIGEFLRSTRVACEQPATRRWSRRCGG